MPIIEPHILPRNDIPIANRYEIINNTTDDDFHIVIYFIDTTKCRLIIRRLDEPFGWNQNLTLRVFSLSDNTYNDIIVGSSTENFKSVHAVMYPILKPIDVNQQQMIPKVIIQTGPTNDMPILKYNSVLSFIELNPEYEYRFYDDISSRKFMRENYDEQILTAYDMLVPGAFKADLFRYCYLHKNGGCYFDCKMILREPLRNIVDKKAELILCKDIAGSNRYYNAVIMSAKNTLGSVIVACVKNIYGNLITSDQLAVTGPQLMYDSLDYKNMIIPFEHFINGTDWNKNYRKIGVRIKGTNKTILNKFYNGYYESIGNNYYGVLNKKKEVYYKNRQHVGKYIVFVYPNPYHDTFQFSLLQGITNNDSIIVKHNGTGRWKFDLKIKLIDTLTDKERVIHVGSSMTRTKQVAI